MVTTSQAILDLVNRDESHDEAKKTAEVARKEIGKDNKGDK